MSSRIHMTLWLGCALVAALEFPRSGAQFGQDIHRFWEHGAVLGSRAEPVAPFAPFATRTGENAACLTVASTRSELPGEETLPGELDG